MKLSIYSPFIGSRVDVRSEDHDGVAVVHDTWLLVALYGDPWLESPDYKYGAEEFQNAVKELDAHYYAQEHENFFIHVAVEEARKAGKSVVVVENLS